MGDDGERGREPTPADEPTDEATTCPRDIGRREVVLNGLVAIGVLPGALAFGGFAFRYLVPLKQERDAEVLLGREEEFPPGRPRTFNGLFGNDVIVMRREEGLVAFGTRCSHLGCFVYWDPTLELEEQSPRGGFYCPCHQGKFRADGSVFSGPPPQGLPRFQVEEREQLVYLRVPVYGDVTEAEA